MGKVKPEPVHVDMEACMKKAGLSDLHPVEVCVSQALLLGGALMRPVCMQTWPSLNAVRELATKVRKLRKGREDELSFQPFVAVELKKYECEGRVRAIGDGARSVHAGSCQLASPSTCR